MTTITKTIETPGWDAGARTVAQLSGNGAYSFSVGQAIGVICGLNDEDHDANYYEIDHAFFIESNQYRIIEGGVTKTSKTTFPFEATFKIGRIDGQVRYYVNGLWVYTSLTPSSGVVFLDCSLYAFGDEIFLGDVEELGYSEQWVEAALSPLSAYGTTETGQWVLSELLPLTVEVALADWNEVNVSLSSLVATGTSETELNTVNISVLPLSATAEEIRVNYAEISVSLSPLVVAIADSEISRIQVNVLPLVANGFESLLLPEYNAIQIELWPLVVGGIQFEDDPAEIDIEFEPLVAIGTTELVNILNGNLLPITVETYLSWDNYITTQWPQWGLQINQLETTTGTSDVVGVTYLTIPAPIFTAEANDYDNASTNLTIPAPILTAFAGGRAILRVPSPTLTATGTVQAFASATLEVPAPELTATASTQVGATVELEVPAPTLTAATGAYASLEVLAPILTATGSVEHLARVALTLPFIELTATAKVGTLALVELEIPSPSLEATGIVGAVAHATLVLPAIILTAIGRVSPGIGIAATALATETTYAINLTTGAVTNLLLGEIDRLVTAHGRLYGLRGEELVRLDGDLDGATTIPAMIRFAPQTFGSNRTKRANTVYLSSREDDGLTLELIEDESRVWRYQTATDTALAYGTHKVKVGRGVKFHTAGLAVYNRNGGRMDIGGIEVLVDTHAPRPKS